MSPDEKVLLEGLFYIFLILSAPFFYWVSSNVCAIVFARLFPIKSIKIEIETDDGAVKVVTLNPKDDEALFNALSKAKRKSKHVSF